MSKGKSNKKEAVSVAKPDTTELVAMFGKVCQFLDSYRKTNPKFEYDYNDMTYYPGFEDGVILTKVSTSTTEWEDDIEWRWVLVVSALDPKGETVATVKFVSEKMAIHLLREDWDDKAIHRDQLPPSRTVYSEEPYIVLSGIPGSSGGFSTVDDLRHYLNLNPQPKHRLISAQFVDGRFIIIWEKK